MTVDCKLPRDPHKLSPFQSATVAFLSNCERGVKSVVLQSGEHFLGGKVEQLHARIRMLLGKVCHRPRQETARKGGRVTNTQPHALSSGAHPFQHFVGSLEQFARFA